MILPSSPPEFEGHALRFTSLILLACTFLGAALIPVRFPVVYVTPIFSYAFATSSGYSSVPSQYDIHIPVSITNKISKYIYI